MKNNKSKRNTTNKKTKHNDKGQVFVKVMAGFLALLMVVAACATLIYALIG